MAGGGTEFAGADVDDSDDFQPDASGEAAVDSRLFVMGAGSADPDDVPTAVGVRVDLDPLNVLSFHEGVAWVVGVGTVLFGTAGGMVPAGADLKAADAVNEAGGGAQPASGADTGALADDKASAEVGVGLTGGDA